MAEKRILVSGDLTSDDKFKEAMEAIRDKGFIETHRSGDTGIGKTLEDELGVEENSVQAADLGAVELKANRKNSNSKITLFTKSPDKRGVNNKILRTKYGYKKEESKELNPAINILHTTVNGKGFNTLDAALKSVALKTRSGGYQFWVVGNRTVKNELLKTDVIITELAPLYGLTPIFTVDRNIPNKVMPSQNSPTNVSGATGSTMTMEHIIVLRKN